MSPHTFRLLLGLTLVTAGPLASQSSDSATPPIGAIEPAGALPPGWTARPDKGGEAKTIKFVEMQPGYHLTLGPATILYRTSDQAEGPFHTLATFRQTKKPPHPEGYGLFVGGQDLSSDTQSYTYFLVRGDGTYLIKQRKGNQTTEISKGWTAHPAVKKENAKGETSNLLEIDAKQDPSKVRFKVNGQTVYTAEARGMQLFGIVGIRANHHVELHIEDFAVHR
jgi:hypothetical protein